MVFDSEVEHSTPNTCPNKRWFELYGIMVENIFRFMVFSATFNNISTLSWWSVLLVEETGEPKENYRVFFYYEQLFNIEEWG